MEVADRDLVAVVPGVGDAAPNLLMIMDAREKADALKTKVAEVKKKWVDAGKQLKTEPIRDVEFTTLIFSQGDITKFFEAAFPGMRPGRGGRRGPRRLAAPRWPWWR